MDGGNYIEARSALPRVTAYAFLDLKDGLMSRDALSGAGCRPLTSRMFWNDEDAYCLVLCRIREGDREKFEDAMGRLEDRMLLTGHTDYTDRCGKMIEAIHEVFGRKNGQ